MDIGTPASYTFDIEGRRARPIVNKAARGKSTLPCLLHACMHRQDATLPQLHKWHFTLFLSHHPSFTPIKSHSAMTFPEFPLDRHSFYLKDRPKQQEKSKDWDTFFEYTIENGDRRTAKIRTSNVQVRGPDPEQVSKELELFDKIQRGQIKVGAEIFFTGSIVFNCYHFAKTDELKWSPTLRIREYELGNDSYTLSDKV